MKYIEQYIKENLFLQPLGKVTLRPDEDAAGWSGVNICVNNVDTNLFISHIDYATWLESKVNTIPEYDNLAIKVHHIENGHNYVDLGLTSGTKWATCNVGASNPQDYGNYYAWGETTTKETYDWSTYLDGNMSSYSDCGTDKDALKGVTNIAGTQYDAAKANWGGKWRMPTKTQQNELRNECYWVWTESYNNSNVKGYIVYKAKTSSDKGVKIYEGETPSSSYKLSDAHIFLPAAGHRVDGDLYGAGSGGHYWSSSLRTGYPAYAWSVSFDSGNVYDDLYRYCGRTIRPVLNQKSKYGNKRIIKVFH